MMQRKVQKMKEEDEENIIAKSGEGVGTAEAFKDEVSTEEDGVRGVETTSCDFQTDAFQNFLSKWLIDTNESAAELSRFFPPDSGNTEQRRWSKRYYQKWTRSRNDIKALPSLILFCKYLKFERLDRNSCICLHVLI